MGSSVSFGLVERDRELTRLGELAAGAAAGRGAALVLEGPAGIGKTSLVAAAQSIAREAELDVLAARGGELERDFAYGVVRQLLEPPLAAADAGQRAELLQGPAAIAASLLGLEDGAELAGDDRAAAALHGLYWLIANLAARRPLLVVVDDLHWADTASIRFVAYLARRVADLPALLVLATRPPAQSYEPDLLERVIVDPEAVRLAPSPLTPAAIGELLRSALRTEPDEQLGRACHRATGGNPFLVRAVLAALAERGDDHPSAEDVPELGGLAVARWVALQLSRQGPAAQRLAQALAVLGVHAELRHAAALAELDEQAAGDAADVLLGAGIFSGVRPLEFAHPILRTAVYEDIPPADRAGRHLAAARLLDAEGAGAERIAPHLLATQPRGDAWVVEMLRTAARQSIGRGAPEAAVRDLRRAVEEPPAPDARAAVLAELGRAEVLAAPPQHAIEHLGAAIAATDDVRVRARLALDLGTALGIAGRFGDAVAPLREAAEAVEPVDPELGRQLRGLLIVCAHMDARTHGVESEPAAGPPRGETPGERLILAALAVGRLLRGGSAASTIELAARAVDGGIIVDQSSDSALAQNACIALAFAGDFDRCDRAIREGLADARARGSMIGFCRMSVPAGFLRFEEGALAEAERHARDIATIGGEQGYPIASMGVGWLLITLVEQGELEAAEAALLDAQLDGDVPDTFLHNFAIYGRGVLRLAQRRGAEGIADLEELDRREVKWRGNNPGIFPYRSELAIALHAAGERERALTLAREELELARSWGTPGALGRALRRLAAVDDPDRRVELLRESLTTLERSGWRLEHAKTLVELGAAVRRSGARTAAQESLFAGMELAHRCGARPLVERAREEIKATGARPRRIMRTGVDALTASELRVARMAADGLSNREIASALFVTTRTVEVHLTSAYRKLGIDSRGRLAEALAGAPLAATA